MIIPSIDLERGRTVQLVGGETPALDAGDPRPLLERFSLVGEVAVVDLDAAKGEGDNAELVRELCRTAPVRVGGGIRDVGTALDWLDAGAEKIVIGTSARPELLRELQRERLLVALDARDGEIVTHGWRERTGRTVLERIEELNELCAGFLVTFVEREGRLQGTDLERAATLVEAAGRGRVTIAGGVTTPGEVAELDRLGADAQVGMALYTGRMSLADAFAAPLRSDREDGLWPTLVVDERHTALGLAYSSRESLRGAIETRRGTYWSRRRGLWEKGATSGAGQELLAVDLDCDRDTLRFTVRQAGAGFCHEATRTCFGDDLGLGSLERRLLERIAEGDPASNTVKLARDGRLLAAKLAEEARELAEAHTFEDVRHEAADLLYFLLVSAAARGVPLSAIEGELDARQRKVRRRACVAKESR